MNIKQMFLNLTQYTVPHGYEDSLRKYLPKGVKRDDFGNYFITIGNNNTLFTCHLDTVSRKVEKVNHVIEGNIIRTDGTTILGGDNKAGVCVLLNMIEHNIPGTYYFFAGEEPTSKNGGLYGSKMALAANPEYFKKFKRAVCFDRKYEGSIVVRQMARFTCSDEFVTALQEQFLEHGLEFKPDETGWYTDTAVFINVIPEVTNLSIGVYKEHSVEEYVDMDYIERISEAALHINWENLPTVRIPKKESTKEEGVKVQKFKLFKSSESDKKIFDIIDGYLSNANFLCLNDDEFEPGANMIFSQWHKEVRILIKIEDGIIWMNNKRVGNLEEFEKFAGIGFEQKMDMDKFVDLIDHISENSPNGIKIKNLELFFKKYRTSIEEFEEYYNAPDCELKAFLKYNPKTQKITIV
jgi:hypothetical protein